MNREQFKAICKKTQPELMQYLVSKLRKKYNSIKLHKDFIFAEGDIPICLVAHLDTVHKEPPRVFVEEEDRISSPQGIGGDDRCGVYAILQIIKKYKCSVLFCCDEEVGGIGAMAFGKTTFGKDFKFLIELDRKGKTDAVFYECDNPAFTDYITGFGPWEEAFGSYTDICDIGPDKGCAGVNFSVGYYNQHTLNEYVVPSEVDYCIDNVCKLIEASKDIERFEFIQAEYYRGYYGYGYKDLYSESRWDEGSIFLIQYKDEVGNISYEEYEARNEYEAIGKFVCEHQYITYYNVLDVIDEGMYVSNR